jgi:hypothetical protein
VLPTSDHATRIGFTAFEPAPPGGYYATFPRECLVGIIIGDRLFESEHRQNALTLIRARTPQIQMRRARIDRRAFRVIVEPCEGNADGST